MLLSKGKSAVCADAAKGRAQDAFSQEFANAENAI